MTLTFVHLKTVVRELSGIRTELKRLGDLMEADLAMKGFHYMPGGAGGADVSQGQPATPQVAYVDEELDWARENIPEFDRLYNKDKEE